MDKENIQIQRPPSSRLSSTLYSDEEANTFDYGNGVSLTKQAQRMLQTDHYNSLDQKQTHNAFMNETTIVRQ